MDPLPRMGVKVGLGGSIAQRIITDPYCQVDVKNLWWNETILIH